MKVLKIFGIVVLVAIVVFLVAGLFIDKSFHFEKTAEMPVSKEKVWNNVLYFKNHDSWSQWREKDPNMAVEIKGNDGTVGSSMSWKSDHKEVGQGSQTITNIIEGERVDSKLNFVGMGEATTYMVVEGDASNTKVTWALDFEVGYPINALFALGGSGQMDDMFKRGFELLEKASK